MITSLGMKQAAKRWLKTVLGFGITLFFSYLIFSELDWDSVWPILTSASAFPLLMAFFCLVLDFFLRIVRWGLMLKAMDSRISIGKCFWPFMVGLALNNVLPLRGGDIVRVFGFSQYLNMPSMRILGTIILERLLDLMTLLIVFYIGLIFIQTDLFPQKWVTTCSVIAVLGGLSIGGLFFFPHFIRRLLNRLIQMNRLQQKGWSNPLKQRLDHVFDALLLLGSPLLILRLTILSLLAWFLEGGIFAFSLQAVHIESNFVAAWFSLATGTLATLIPSSPGYVGTFDYFAILGLAAYGIIREQSTIAVLLVHLILWVPTTLIGLLYFLNPKGLQVWKRSYPQMENRP